MSLESDVLNWESSKIYFAVSYYPKPAYLSPNLQFNAKKDYLLSAFFFTFFLPLFINNGHGLISGLSCDVMINSLLLTLVCGWEKAKGLFLNTDYAVFPLFLLLLLLQLWMHPWEFNFLVKISLTGQKIKFYLNCYGGGSEAGILTHLDICSRNPLYTSCSVQLILFSGSKTCKSFKSFAKNELVVRLEHAHLTSSSKPEELLFLLAKSCSNSPIFHDTQKRQLRNFNTSLWHECRFPFNFADLYKEEKEDRVKVARGLSHMLLQNQKNQYWYKEYAQFHEIYSILNRKLEKLWRAEWHFLCWQDWRKDHHAWLYLMTTWLTVNIKDWKTKKVYPFPFFFLF